ncbi:NAD(P)H-dependent oxidoreductase [Amycolatopsis ultiminotia]|uniref:NAD(P)H-dependent oxidoreductase n=1 Tax=Amycolatopsis ultiminotia TaxID=543629 RepID=A0ABP6WJK0_9PSEU
MTDKQLAVIVGSVRPGRIGPAFARWFADRARAHGGFEVVVHDLAEINLPFHNERAHPKTGLYEHAHTRAWSDAVAAADAFVMVTPEYNYGYSAALKNAIDYLNREWADKPVGFLSYGGIGAGTRAIQQLKQVVTTLRMIPVFEAVNIPFAASRLDEHGNVKPDAERDLAASAMLDELARVTDKMRPALAPNTAVTG